MCYCMIIYCGPVRPFFCSCNFKLLLLPCVQGIKWPILVTQSEISTFVFNNLPCIVNIHHLVINVFPHIRGDIYMCICTDLWLQDSSLLYELYELFARVSTSKFYSNLKTVNKYNYSHKYIILYKYNHNNRCTKY